MQRWWRIRSWVFLLVLNLGVGAAVGFSFLRPIGVAYRSTYTYPEQRFSDGTRFGELSVAYFDGAAFHEGGLVVFRFMSYHDSYKTAQGVRWKLWVRSARQWKSVPGVWSECNEQGIVEDSAPLVPGTQLALIFLPWTLRRNGWRDTV